MGNGKNMDRQEVINQIWAGVTKWWAWAFWVFIGLVGKFGYMLYRGEKMPLWKIVGSAMIACFVGYISSVLCAVYCPDKAKYIVPMATLSSEKIITIIMGIDWSPVVEFLLSRYKKSDK